MLHQICLPGSTSCEEDIIRCSPSSKPCTHQSYVTQTTIGLWHKLGNMNHHLCTPLCYCCWLTTALLHFLDWKWKNHCDVSGVSYHPLLPAPLPVRLPAPLPELVWPGCRSPSTSLAHCQGSTKFWNPLSKGYKNTPGLLVIVRFLCHVLWYIIIYITRC